MTLFLYIQIRTSVFETNLANPFNDSCNVEVYLTVYLTVLMTLLSPEPVEGELVTPERDPTRRKLTVLSLRFLLEIPL